MHFEKSYFEFFETLRRMILSLMIEGFRQILFQATESAIVDRKNGFFVDWAQIG